MFVTLKGEQKWQGKKWRPILFAKERKRSFKQIEIDLEMYVNIQSKATKLLNVKHIVFQFYENNPSSVFYMTEKQRLKTIFSSLCNQIFSEQS